MSPASRPRPVRGRCRAHCSDASLATQRLLVTRSPPPHRGRCRTPGDERRKPQRSPGRVEAHQTASICGAKGSAPGWIRTNDLRIRSGRFAGLFSCTEPSLHALGCSELPSLALTWRRVPGHTAHGDRDRGDCRCRPAVPPRPPPPANSWIPGATPACCQAHGGGEWGISAASVLEAGRSRRVERRVVLSGEAEVCNRGWSLGIPDSGIGLCNEGPDVLSGRPRPTRSRRPGLRTRRTRVG